MASLHPFFVHFPIAILLVAVLFDAYGAYKAHTQSTHSAFVLQLLAGIAAIFAAVSGNQAETILVKSAELNAGVGEALDAHISMGNLMIWVIITFVGFRMFAVLEKKTWAQAGWVFPALGLVVAGLVIFTGLLGGDLSADILDFYKKH